MTGAPQPSGLPDDPLAAAAKLVDVLQAATHIPQPPTGSGVRASVPITPTVQADRVAAYANLATAAALIDIAESLRTMQRDTARHPGKPRRSLRRLQGLLGRPAFEEPTATDQP